MQVSVDLGQRAAGDGLAREVRRRVLSNVGRGRTGVAFSRMWGTVVVVRRPILGPDGTTSRPSELTLRFDFGHLMIHGGRVGRPDVTLWGSDESILAIGELVPTWALHFGAGLLGDVTRRYRALSIATLGVPKNGKVAGLEIFGRWNHPRFVYRLARILDGSP